MGVAPAPPNWNGVWPALAVLAPPSVGGVCSPPKVGAGLGVAPAAPKAPAPPPKGDTLGGALAPAPPNTKPAPALPPKPNACCGVPAGLGDGPAPKVGAAAPAPNAGVLLVAPNVGVALAPPNNGGLAGAPCCCCCAPKPPPGAPKGLLFAAGAGLIAGAGAGLAPNVNGAAAAAGCCVPNAACAAAGAPPKVKVGVLGVPVAAGPGVAPNVKPVDDGAAAGAGVCAAAVPPKAAAAWPNNPGDSVLLGCAPKRLGVVALVSVAVPNACVCGVDPNRAPSPPAGAGLAPNSGVVLAGAAGVVAAAEAAAGAAPKLKPAGPPGAGLIRVPPRPNVGGGLAAAGAGVVT